MPATAEQQIARRRLNDKEISHIDQNIQMKKTRLSPAGYLLERFDLWMVQREEDRLTAIAACLDERLTQAHESGDQQATFILETLFAWSQLQRKNKLSRSFEEFISNKDQLKMALLNLGIEAQRNQNSTIFDGVPESLLREDLLLRKDITLLDLYYGVITYSSDPITEAQQK